MKFLQLKHNPLFIYHVYSRRWGWRFGAAIGLTLLAYSPLLIMLYSIVMGFIGAVVVIVVSTIFAAVYDPQTAGQTILMINDSVATLSWAMIYDWLYELYNDIEQFASDFMPGVGILLFYSTVSFLLLLITFFAPLMSASLISGERQRQTLEILLITQLSDHEIVIGKLSTALVYILLPIGAIWTLLMACYSTQGIALIEMVVALLILIITAVSFTTIGLFASVLTKSILRTMMVIYGIILPLLFVAPALFMLPVTVITISLDMNNEAQEWINFYGWGIVASLNPLVSGFITAAIYQESGSILFDYVSQYRQEKPYPLPWIPFSLFYSLLSLLLVRLTTSRLRRLNHDD